MKIDHPDLSVVHFVDQAFAATETFIYDFVTSLRRYRTCVLAREHVNQDRFEYSGPLQVRPARADRTLSSRIRSFFGRPPGWESSRCVQEFISKTNPQVVHAHFGSRGWEALPLCERYGLPLVTSFYGHDASALPRVDDWMHRYQELFAKGEAFVVEGPTMKERLVSLGCPISKISIVPLVVRPERYRYAPQQLRAGDTLRILFVGRFVEKKGLPILLNALKEASDALRPVDLRIIGDGENRAEIENLVSCLKLTEVVHFLGLLPREEVVRQLEASHLLAVPSRTAANGDTEGGAPTILGEAMACGTVIAATRHADIPFVIPMYEDYLADENDVTGFARLLVRLRERTDQWPGLLAQAHRHVQDQHGADTIHRLEAIYDRCHQPGTESTLESKAA